MQITPDRYDSLILRLVDLSPLARHILDGEHYRLRIETDDVDSESVLQECVLALRDDMADIGLYLNCQLGELYEDLAVLTQVLDVLEYIMPNAFYPKLRSDSHILPQLKAIITGGVGDDSTILLFLRWLGSGPDCYVPAVTPGAHWLADRLTSTALFDLYLSRLTEVEATLDHPIALAPDALLTYTTMIRNQAVKLYAALNQLQELAEFNAYAAKLHRRIDLYIRYLLQPAHIAENAWLRLTNYATLSDDVQLIYKLRWREFSQGHRLYGAHYLSLPEPKFTTLAVLGICIRLYAEHPDATRTDYLAAFNQECQTGLTFTIPLHSLLIRSTALLYPTH